MLFMLLALLSMIPVNEAREYARIDVASIVISNINIVFFFTRYPILPFLKRIYQYLYYGDASRSFVSPGIRIYARLIGVRSYTLMIDHLLYRSTPKPTFTLYIENKSIYNIEALYRPGYVTTSVLLVAFVEVYRLIYLDTQYVD